MLPFSAYAVHGRKGIEWVTWHITSLRVIDPVLTLRQMCIPHNAILGQGSGTHAITCSCLTPGKRWPYKAFDKKWQKVLQSCIRVMSLLMCWVRQMTNKSQRSQGRMAHPSLKPLPFAKSH